MADNILNIPSPTKEKGQRSLSVSEAYFTRFIPSWTFPSGLSPEAWRTWSRVQPVASDCKDILISSLQSLDWKISPRDSDMRDELKGTVKHYTRLLEKGGDWLGLDWTGLLEWLMNDLHDLPFGAAAEIGRKNDSPDGRVMWIKPLDAGTLYPTLNRNFPVMQYYGNAVKTINFPAHAIARMYMNPRTELQREGWGMAPPERVYLALEMLSRGDQYYANLLLDTPPAGILDLGDMEKETALEWISSFRTFVANGGVDGFKVPVLYEHTVEPKFISFGKVPNEIMYDKITLKYAALVTAAYGMTLNDIGLQASSGGETLAGGIRSEKKTRKTGLARAKKKLKYFFESIIPDTLMFEFVDMDDELATALGRARLANATAWGQLIDKGIFDRKEARLQTVQDGLVTISVPEEPPTEDDWGKMKMENAQKMKLGQPGGEKPAERPGMLGNPQPPSVGGDGEVKRSFGVYPEEISRAVQSVVFALSPSVRELIESGGDDNMEPMKSAAINTVFSDEGLGEAVKILMKSRRIGSFSKDGIEDELSIAMENAGIHYINASLYVDEVIDRCEKEFPAFLGKAIAYNLINSSKLFSDDASADVEERINKSLPEFVSYFIGDQIARTVEFVKENSSQIEKYFPFKTNRREAPQTIIVEAAEAKLPDLHLSVPERSVTVNPANISLDPEFVLNHQTNIDSPTTTVNMPEEKEHVINLTVHEKAVTVNSPVNVAVPGQEPSKVEVINQVNPTPIELKNEVVVQPADVKIPKVKREIQKVHRDMNLNIDGTVTEIEYEE